MTRHSACSGTAHFIYLLLLLLKDPVTLPSTLLRVQLQCAVGAAAALHPAASHRCFIQLSLLKHQVAVPHPIISVWCCLRALVAAAAACMTAGPLLA